MPRKIASPKSTSGVGFAFEDKVFAYFMLTLLDDSILFSDIACGYRLEEIKAQVRVDGFVIEDILLIYGDQDKKRIFFSLKNNKQFTNKKAPEDFVSDVWEQVELGNFDRNNDYIGMIAEPQNSDAENNLLKLIKMARNQTIEEFNKRIKESRYSNKEVIDMYDSFQNRNDLTRLPSEILKIMLFRSYDFTKIDSKDNENAILKCQGLLESNESSEAKKFWNTICDIATTIRTSGGSIDKQQLLNKVKNDFFLKQFHNYANDWKEIDKYFNIEQILIQNTIGNINIPRNDLIGKIKENGFGKFNIFIGNSGCGKSALIREISKIYKDKNKILWINVGTIIEYIKLPKLSHNFFDCLANCSKHLIIILDEIEKINDNNFELINKILISFQENCQYSNSFIIASCRKENYNKIFLKYKNIKWKIFDIPNIEKNELIGYLNNYPSLKNLISNPQNDILLNNLKILDNIVRLIDSGCGLNLNSNPIEIINWWWKNNLDYKEQSLLEKYSIDEGDNRKFSKKKSDFTTEELALLESDKMKNIFDINERSWFKISHDTYTDWGRFEKILSETSENDGFIIEKSQNPFWVYAITLYSQFLIKDNKSRWVECLKNDHLSIIFLQGLVYIPNYLDDLSDILLENNAEYLKKFMEQFLFYCTEIKNFFKILPNKLYGEHVFNFGNEDEKYLFVEPIYTFWEPVIKFLYKNIELIYKIMPNELSRFCYIYLSDIKTISNLRKNVSEMVVKLSEYAYRERYTSGNWNEIVFHALDYAYNHFPEKVEILLLKLSGSKAPEDSDGKLYKSFLAPGTYIKETFNSGIVPEPWPNGPIAHQNSSFQKLLTVQSDAILGIMKSNPELAKKIILATYIECPEERMKEHRYNPKGLIGDNIFYNDPYNKKGPFFHFLLINLKYGLKTIVELVDFCTEVNFNDGTYFDLNINDYTKKFIGNNIAINMTRNEFNNIVTSALWALEQFLYIQIDLNKNIDSIIDFILKNAKSISFISLLLDIGRYKPSIFLNILKPLLFSWKTYEIDTMQIVNNNQSIAASKAFGFRNAKSYMDWIGMPHRNFILKHNIIGNLLKNEDLQKDFKIVLENWKRIIKEVENVEVKNDIQNLIDQFTLENYEEIIIDGQKGFKYKKTEEQKKEEELNLIKSKVLIIPYKVSECLNGKTISTPEKIINNLNILEKNKDIFKNNDIEIFINAKISLTSLLIIKHSSWLDQNIDIKNNNYNLIKNYILKPPLELKTFDMSVNSDSWERFICQALPHIWVRNKKNKEIRSLILKSLLLFSNNYIHFLSYETYKLRNELGNNDYVSFINLLIYTAKIKYELTSETVIKKYCENDLNPTGINKNSRDLNRANEFYKNIENNFLNGKFIKLPTSIDKYVFNYRFSYSENEDIQNSLNPLIDIEYINKAFLNIFNLDKAISHEEEKYFMDFWHDMEQIVINRLNKLSKAYPSSGGKDLYPSYGYEMWILEEIILQILIIRDKNSRSILYKDILDLLPNFYLYVTSFFDFLFSYTENENFYDVWQAMTDYLDRYLVNNSGNSIKNSHTRGKIIFSILGINGFCQLKESDVDLVSEMLPYHLKYLNNIFESYHNGRDYLNYLAWPVFKNIRIFVLRDILENHYKKFNNEEIINSFVEFLKIIWAENYDELINNKLINIDLYYTAIIDLVSKGYKNAITLQKIILKK